MSSSRAKQFDLEADFYGSRGAADQDHLSPVCGCLHAGDQNPGITRGVEDALGAAAGEFTDGLD